MKQLYLIACAVLVPAVTFAKLNVIATTPDFASIATEIGGDRVEVASLARPTEDPHFVDARPSFIAKLNRADAVIEGGAELEIGWLPPLLEGARNTKLDSGQPGHIACAGDISLLEVPSVLDRSKGDIHAAGNPHFMVDPASGRAAARHICDAFCSLDAASCDYFRDNLAKFNARLDTKMAEWKMLLAPYQGAHIVAYHNTWPYFARTFGLNIDLFLEPKPGIPPTPSNLAAVESRMRADKIGVILVEPYENRKTAETVARDTGATVVDVAQFPGGVKGTEAGYIELIDYLVHTIAKALGEQVMIEALSIMTWPLIACLLLPGILVYFGLHIVKREIIFVDLALAQVAALGTCFAILLGHEPSDWHAYAWSLGFTLVGAAIFTLTRTTDHRVPQEALIGIVYVVAAAAGLLLLSRSAEGNEELRRTLIGDVLLVRPGQVGRTFLLYLVIGTVHFAFRRKFITISFDPERARSEKFSIRWWDFLFYGLFGLVVTSFVQIGGVLLVFSYLIIPAVCANFLVESLAARLALGWLTATLGSCIGLYASYALDLPTGAAIVCALGALLVLSAVGTTLRRRNP